jgi:hypothetical protein
MTLELLLATAGIAAGLGIRELWTRKRTAGETAKMFAEAASVMIGPLRAELLEVHEELAVLQSRIVAVERDNKHLSGENTRLRARVAILESQLRDLGIKPASEHDGDRQ